MKIVSPLLKETF